MLTHQSLDALCKSYKLSVTKATGTFDYNKYRSPLTHHTAGDIDYMLRDVSSLYKGIEIYLDRYGSIDKIPYTQTGAVRQRVKKLFKNDTAYHKKMSALIPDYVEYCLLQLVKWGGYTHANFLYAGLNVLNVDSWDISSSYPYQMISKKYPMSRFRECDVNLFYNAPEDKYAFILHICIDNYDINTYNTYISVSHCVKVVDGVYDNGRVMSAKYIELYVTDIDYSIIADTCDQDITIMEAWCAVKDYLPVKLVLEILDLYGKKTSQKGIDNNLYMRSKEELNSIYGMMLAALVYGITMCVNGMWDYTPPSMDDIVDRLSYLSASQYKNNYSYAWGVWVVAYGRRQLWDLIIAQDKYDAYGDTDSGKLVKGYDKDWILRYNGKLVSDLDALMISRGIDPMLTRPLAPNGKAIQIGVFDYDAAYSEFKTLGAKRYVYRDVKDNKLHMTVSGVNKQYGADCLHDNIDNFMEGMVIPYDYCRRLVLKYDNAQPTGIVMPDGWVLDQQHAVKAIPSTYTMTLDRIYTDLISAYNAYNNDLPSNVESLHKIIQERGGAKNEEKK